MVDEIIEAPDVVEITPAMNTPHILTLEEIMAGRRAAYELEADALFFGSERGENTKEDWLAKITEIKLRFPKPETASDNTSIDIL